MQTVLMLMARYDALPVISLETVRMDFFASLSPPVFLRKLGNGEIPLPVVRLDGSQKGPKGVTLTDLAAYLDERAAAGRKEARALQS